MKVVVISSRTSSYCDVFFADKVSDEVDDQVLTSTWAECESDFNDICNIIDDELERELDNE